MAGEGEDVYCTLLMSDSYLPGAQVLAHSLRDAGTRKKLAVLVTLDNISAGTMTELDKLYDYIIPVERIVNRSPANLYLMGRWDLKSTFTKIGLWHQTRFRKIVYLDADVVALRAPDELFNIKAPFAAAPDIGWPDCFNSGVLVLTPNMADYYSLLALAQRGVSFDGADQGLLNMHFKDYHRISFRYNCTPSGHYQYVPAYRHFEADIALLHFIGKDKPWSAEGQSSRVDSIYNELLGRWWAVHDRHLRVQSESDGEQSPAVGESSRSTEQPQHAMVSTQATQFEHEHESPPEAAVLGGDHHEDTSIPQQPSSEPASAPAAPFVAPQTTWDPTKSAPPPDSQPEAPNFPQRTYEMSQDRGLFQPPSSYPEPPKDLWYEVPKPPPVQESLKPIFPWETSMPKATRVFAEDFALPSPSTPLSPPPLVSSDEDGTTTTSADLTTASTVRMASPDPWSNYSATNAWDEIPEIEQYISNVIHRRQRSTQSLPNHTSSTSNTQAEDEEEILSPGVEGEGEAGRTSRKTGRRRPSLRLTDFPTELERPSLPVTPAPVRGGSTFWGSERKDEDAESTFFPPAEGVPRQEDWDPAEKLRELTKRQTGSVVAVVGDEEAVKPIKEATLRDTVEEEDDDEEGEGGDEGEEEEDEGDEDEEEDEDEATPILEREEGDIMGRMQLLSQPEENEVDPPMPLQGIVKEEPSVTMPPSLSSSVDIQLLEKANAAADAAGEMEGGIETGRAAQSSFVSTAV